MFIPRAARHVVPHWQGTRLRSALISTSAMIICGF